MTFIGLFNVLTVVSVVAFYAVGGSFKVPRRHRKDAWKWLAVLSGLQLADVVTTLVAFGIFDPSVEANHLASAIGVPGMVIIKLVLVPAFLTGVVMTVSPTSAVEGLRGACFVSSLAVVSNMTGLTEVARYLLIGFRF